MRERWINRLHAHLRIAALATHRLPNLVRTNLDQAARIETVLLKRYSKFKAISCEESRG